MVYAFWHVEESTWVTLNLADVQKRRDKLKVGPTHEKVCAALRWHENIQMWSVKGAMWCVRKVLASRCIAPGTRAGHVLGQHCNTFTQSTRARAWLAHGACKFLSSSSTGKWFMKACMTYEKRWDEKRWAGIRWEELRCDKVWSVKSAVWSVGREECSVKCGMWNVKKAMRSEKCEVWTVKFQVWSVKCEECSLKSAVWSV